jgi:hypothetical protein
VPNLVQTYCLCMEPERPQDPERPQENDPYRSVWRMTPVWTTGSGRSELKIVAGIIAGLVVFMPFGIVASVLWGWWGDETNWGPGGWATVLLGLSAASAMGGFVASDRS